MTSSYQYNVEAQWRGGVVGSVKGAAHAPIIEFASPPEFRGEPGFWTPEHFLVAAVAACFVTTFRAITELSKFEATGLELSAEGVLEKGENGFQFTRIILRPVLTIAREVDQERAMRLLEKTKHSCLVSRSLKSEVTMEPQVRVATQTISHVA
jgi:peroxiredoxin-like protein